MKRLSAVVIVAALLASSATSANDNEVDKRKAAEANAQLALAYMRQGDLTTARDKLEKAMDQDPRNPTTQLAAGFLYDRLGDDKQAQEHFEQAVKLSREDPNVVNSYAVFVCRKGDKKKGEAMLLKAAASPLNRAPEVAYANAGRCARADGRPQDAEKYFRQALSYKAEQTEALYEMASLENDLGNYLQARAFLERYSSVAPVSAASLWLAYRIERGLGDNQQATLYADRIKRDFPMSAEMSALVDAERAPK
jgi:type IV pilus assembly protein PilF